MVVIGALVGTSFSLFTYNAPGRKENTIITGSSKIDQSGASAPVLATNMIPVYYDSTNKVWKKADENNTDETYKWYDYNNKMWANAVTVTFPNRSKYLNASAGKEIPMNDINTMWVWIPRFKATGNTATYNGTNNINYPGAFDITFVNTNTSAHDAFTFGTQALNGFWMGKFEISHTTLTSSTTANNLECKDNLCSNANGIIIKPNVKSLRYNNLSNYFYASLSMKKSYNNYGFNTTNDPTLDIHIIKNPEWAAVAYLTQSIYGRCSSSTRCSVIGINNSSSFTTGYGAPAGTSRDTNNGTYETSLGMNASTTGNIYGVYDMSGGAYELIMGVYTEGVKKWSGRDKNSNSGFNGYIGGDGSYFFDGVAFPDAKYYNTYTTSDNYTSSNLQHALTETGGWYGVYAFFVNNLNCWFVRGGTGLYRDAGIFYVSNSDGSDFESYGSRAILIK